LRQNGKSLIVRVVSAAQIIEEIKALPPEERAQVVEFVKETEKPAVSYIDQETFDAAVKEVFTKHRELLRKLAS